MKYRQITAFALIVIMLFVGIFPVFAEEEALASAKSGDYSYTRDIDVIPDFSPDYIEGRGNVIDSIPSGGSQWSASSASMNLTGISSMQSYPYSSFDGDGCLNISCDEARNNTWYYVTRSFGSRGIDLSDCGSLVFALCCDYVDSSSKISVSVNIYTGASKKLYRYDGVTPETWNGVICNISGLESRNRVTSIKIGIKRSGSDEGNFSAGFKIDGLFGCTTNALPRAIAFSSEVYSINGTYNTLVFSDDGNTMLVNAAEEDISEEISLTSGRIPSTVFDEADAVKVRFRICEGASLSSLQLRYTTQSNPSFKQNEPILQNVEQTGDTQVCYFILPSSGITQLKLIMNAEAHGNFEIYSITPASFYTPLSKDSGHTSPKLGAITSCRISSDTGRRIVIKGSFSRDELSAYRGQGIALYELMPHEDNEKLFDGSLNPIKTATVSENFSFEIPLYEGERSRLTSRFAVILYDNTSSESILLGSPVYITNPDILADHTVNRNSSLTKKGFICDGATAAENSVSHTVINLDLGRLFADNSGAVVHEYAGQKYLFDSDYVAELDSRINDMLIAGCSVNLRLLLTQPIYSSMRSLLVDGASDVSVAYRLGFNVSSERSVRALEAAADFIARRYFISDGGSFTASGIIVGSDLDYAFRYYNLGLNTLRDYTDSYLRAFRVIYGTVRSVCSNAKLYIPLGSEWDGKGVYWDGKALKFSSRDLLDSLSAQLKAEGQINCSLTFDPYTDREPLITEIMPRDLTGGSISLLNVPELCRFLRQTRLLCDGAPRSLMLVHDTEPVNAIVEAVDSSDAAYEYILAYEIISSDVASGVECFITDDSFIRSEDKRGFYSVLKGIDTSSGDSIADSALEHFGLESWSAVCEGISGINSSIRFFTQRGAASSLPPSITGSCGLWDFGAHDSGSSQPRLVLSSRGDVIDSGSGHDKLSFSRGGLYGAAYIFPYTRDLTSASVISFPFSCSGECQLCVEFRSAAGQMRFSGSCSPDVSHTVVCSIADFAGLKAVDSVAIFIESKNGSSVEADIGSFTASSLSLDSDGIADMFLSENEKLFADERGDRTDRLVRIIAAVLAAALIIEAAYIILRVKRISENARRLEEEKRERFRQRFGQ